MRHDLIDDVFAVQIGETELITPTRRKDEVWITSYARGLIERGKTKIVLLSDLID